MNLFRAPFSWLDGNEQVVMSAPKTPTAASETSADARDARFEAASRWVQMIAGCPPVDDAYAPARRAPQEARRGWWMFGGAPPGGLRMVLSGRER